MTGYTLASSAQSTISGTMPADNVTVDVVYTINSYTLTINYIDEDDNVLSAPHTETLDYNASYSVGSPAVTGYTLASAAQATIAGNMPADDVEVDVLYTINEYTVTFKPGDHAVPTDADVPFSGIDHGTQWGNAGITVPTYTADGYYYQTGWKDEGGNAVTIPTGTTPITGDMTFIAVWTAMEEVTVTGNSATRTYNGATQTVTGILPITAPSGVSAATASGWESEFSATGSRKDVGGTTVVVTGADILYDGSIPYHAIMVNGLLTINPAAVTITANDASKYAGTPDPAFTASVTSGTIYGGDFTYGVTRSNGGVEAAGTYAGVLEVGPDTGAPNYGDYIVTLVPGGFTINLRPTSTTVTATPANGTSGSALTIHGSVADISGAAAYAPGFSGSVVITFNGHTYTVPVAADGTFTLPAVTTRPMHTGSHTVTASYQGDGVFAPSSDTAIVTVTAAPAETATLTIRFLLLGAGTQLADPYTETFEIGDAYSVAALAEKLISGYTRVSIVGSTSGTITGDHTITVYYRGVAATPSPTPTATPTPTPTPTETPVEVMNPEPPKAGPERSWALVNLIMTVLTAVWSGYMLLRYFGKRKDEDAAAKSATEIRKHGFKRIASLVPAIGGIVAFILTEDVRNPMVFTDRWTLLMVAIFLIQAGVAAVAARSHKEEPKEA